ncbi:hypothetical protein BDR26DRAFT_866197 [Obelidium mucronatum]|nr:hypothetical protein BDR26DRAFT_866197 [Obelidium mucronatum]
MSTSPNSRVSRIASSFGADAGGSGSSSGSRAPGLPARTARGSIKDLIRAFDAPAAQSPPKPPRTPKSTTPLSKPPLAKVQTEVLRPNTESAPEIPPVPVPMKETPPPPPPTLAESPLEPSHEHQPSASHLIWSMIPLPIRGFVQHRILPALACVIALHIISPRLSTAIWVFIFRIVFRKDAVISPPPSRSPKKLVASDTVGGSSFGLVTVLLPAFVIMVAVFMFSRPPPSPIEPKESLLESALSNIVPCESKDEPEMPIIEPVVETIPAPIPKAPFIPERRESILDPTPSPRSDVQSKEMVGNLLPPPMSVSPSLNRNKPLPIPETQEVSSNLLEQAPPSLPLPAKPSKQSPAVNPRLSVASTKQTIPEVADKPSSILSDHSRRFSDGSSFDLTLEDSNNSTLRNPSLLESTGRSGSFLDTLNESFGDSFMVESASLNIFKSPEASPRQSWKQLPSPPPPNLILERDTSITLPKANIPKPSQPQHPNLASTPETTPQFNEQEDERNFVSSIDEDTLNAILYDSTNELASPLISDHELALLFPLPNLPQQQNSRLNISQTNPPTARLPRKIPPKAPTTSSSLSIFNNPHSTSLDFKSMNLTSLPTDFLPHMYLTRLHLAGNYLQELPDLTMSLLPSLRFLDVSDNKIACLTKSLGASCKNLKELYARNCGMVVIEEGALEGLRFLEVLDLSSNKLSSFSNFAFAHNTAKLHTLILSNNKFRTLPPSLGLHRGRELVFLLIGGNPFETTLKSLTDPIVAASLSIIPRVTKDINARSTVVPDDVSFSGSSHSKSGRFGFMDSSASSFMDKSDQGSLYEWDDEDVRSIHDAEFDSNLNGYHGRPAGFDRLRRRSSLPDVNRSDSRRAARRAVTGDSGPGIGGGWEAEASSTTSYHASTNPSYVFIQRLLSHLRDVFDLSPQFHPIKTAIERVNRPSSKQDVRAIEATVNGDDPDAPHLTEEERERIRKRQSPTRRAHIAAEVLSTERTYVNELRTLVNLYADPLERGEILATNDIKAMFSNLKSILYFHKMQLLPNIERAVQDPNQPLGTVFHEASPFFKQYSMYYNNFDTANELVIHLDQLAASGTGQLQSPIKSTGLTSTSISPTSSTQASRRTLAKKYKNLVKIAKSSPSHTQISLQSYLILPVQRLPRYKLLVDQLLESTPLSHPDRAPLQAAAEAIRTCVADCNDKKRETEEIERGLKQFKRIRFVKSKSTGAMSKFVTIQTGQRQYVKETAFRVVKFVERHQSGGGISSEGMADLQFAMIGSRDRFFKAILGSVVEARFTMGTAVSSPAGPPPVAVFGQPHLGAGLDGMSVYGVQRTMGGEFRFLLFTDLLCWCKPIIVTNSSPLSGTSSSNTEQEFDLIRAIEIGPQTKVESMCILGPDAPGGMRFASDRSSSASTEQLRGYAPGPPVKTQRLSGLYNSSLSVTNSRGSSLPSTPVVRELESVLRISDNDSVVYLRGTQTEIIAWEETLKGLGCDGGD